MVMIMYSLIRCFQFSSQQDCLMTNVRLSLDVFSVGKEIQKPTTVVTMHRCPKEKLHT
jgi:hypothetical protein